MRTEEDAGRTELVLAGLIGRQGALLSATAAIGASIVILWFAEFAGFLVGGLSAGGSAYLALATTSVVPVCVGVGALASQLAPTRRLALAGRIALGRDVGTGALPARDSAKPRLRLLSSPGAQALRSERTSVIVWGVSIGTFALILGMVSASISSAGISANIRKELAKLGSGSIATPTGYMSFVFIFFVLAVSLFACAQVGAAHEEEAAERLETLLSAPVSRSRWLGGRLAIAAGAAAVLSALAGVLAWAGAASQGVSIALPQMLEAGANCLPVSLLFLGLAALAYATVPRASAGIAYGLVALAFLWQLVGSLLGVPKWLVEASRSRTSDSCPRSRSAPAPRRS
jgi:ABC-2 type transport system permease protein